MQALNNFVGLPLEEMDTPALVIDLDAMEGNLKRMADHYAGLKAVIRPHAKTHKSPVVAKKQIELGAIGATCAKLAEAEALARGGVTGILIANQIIGRRKIDRLAGLSAWADVTVAVEAAENLRQLAEGAERLGTTINVILEVDTGMNRCGVPPLEGALPLADQAANSAGINYRGIMGYEGHCVNLTPFAKRKEEADKASDLLVRTAGILERAGLACELVSAGGTGTYDITCEFPGITEMQVGSYVFMDANYRRVLAEHFEGFQCALSVLTTVIARPSDDIAICDMGRKTITDEFGMPPALTQGVTLEGLSEEHGKLSLAGEARGLKVGDKVRLTPSHGCTTINLHDYYFGVRGGVLECIWPIEARGCIN